MVQTAARVDMVINTNATWEDAFMFGVTGDTSWSFTSKTFTADIKGTRDAPTALLTVGTADATIVVDDVVQRILHFHVSDAELAALAVGEYVYDLIMIDSITGDRTVLMEGEICVKQGVSAP
jgi:hypothetical protein